MVSVFHADIPLDMSAGSGAWEYFNFLFSWRDLLAWWRIFWTLSLFPYEEFSSRFRERA